MSNEKITAATAEGQSQENTAIESLGEAAPATDAEQVRGGAESLSLNFTKITYATINGVVAPTPTSAIYMKYGLD